MKYVLNEELLNSCKSADDVVMLEYIASIIHISKQTTNADSKSYITTTKDNVFWVALTYTAMQREINYMSISQIRTSVKHLVNAGFIELSVFNANNVCTAFRWFTLTEKGENLINKYIEDLL